MPQPHSIRCGPSESSATQYSRQGKGKRGTHTQKKTTLRAATSTPQGASASPSGPVLPPPLFPGNLLVVAQVQLLLGTVPFRSDTRPSRAGSTA